MLCPRLHLFIKDYYYHRSFCSCYCYYSAPTHTKPCSVHWGVIGEQKGDHILFFCGAYRRVGETKMVQVKKCENGSFSENNEENGDRGDGLLGCKEEERLLQAGDL